MLVGTAITGASTSPPTTEGRAPSMPAATITTLGLAKGRRPVEQPVQARHPHVVDAVHRRAVELGGHRRLLGHRDVGGAGADHGGLAGEGGGRSGTTTVTQRAASWNRAAGCRVGEEPVDVGGRAGDEHVLPARHDASTMAATCSGVLPAPKIASGKPRRRARWWSTLAKPRSS